MNMAALCRNIECLRISEEITMTETTLTITDIYRDNLFFKDADNNQYVISGYGNECRPLTAKSYTIIKSILERLCLFTNIHSPFAEIGKTFPDQESAANYALALYALEDLNSIRKIKELYGKRDANGNGLSHSNPEEEQIIHIIKEKGYDIILAGIQRVKDSGLLEKLNISLEQRVPICS